MLAEHAAASMTLQCGECGAALVLGEYRTTICPYCASPSVAERPSTPGRPDPTYTVPFTVTDKRAKELVAGWSSRHRWIYRSLAGASIAEMKGVYLPACLYSAVVSSTYRAQIGENYTVTETYTTTENGKTVTRTRTRTETEWRGLSGVHTAYATDLVVTASRGLPNDELEHIEPFDLRGLRRYAAALVSGWLVEEATLNLGQCTEMARAEAVQQEERRLAAFMPGDSHRELHFEMDIREETVDAVLLPVWVLAMRPAPDQPPMRVLCNGQSGEVWGPEKISPMKVIAWIALALVVIAIIALVATGGSR